MSVIFLFKNMTRVIFSDFSLYFFCADWKNFQELIERQATIEDFTDTIETIVHRCIVEMSEKKQIPLRNVAKSFILLWHVIESLISRDMTIHSAASFGNYYYYYSSIGKLKKNLW